MTRMRSGFYPCHPWLTLCHDHDETWSLHLSRGYDSGQPFSRLQENLVNPVESTMHRNTLRNKLSGVIAFPVTPFKENLSLDLPGLHHNLTKLLEHPISAIVAAGGTGELYSLTPAEYTRVIELTTLAIEDRVPVIAG